jgi:hypothetical protein
MKLATYQEAFMTLYEPHTAYIDEQKNAVNKWEEFKLNCRCMF